MLLCLLQKDEVQVVLKACAASSSELAWKMQGVVLRMVFAFFLPQSEVKNVG